MSNQGYGGAPPGWGRRPLPPTPRGAPWWAVVGILTAGGMTIWGFVALGDRTRHQASMARQAAAAAEAPRLAAAEDARRERERAEEQGKAAHAAIARRTRIAGFAKMSTAERAKAVVDECHAKCDPDALDDIIGAAQADSEWEALKKLSREQIAAHEKRGEREAREKLATKIEQDLFQRHRNPRSVRAVGPEGTTLEMKGSFCSRQFLFDFQTEPPFRIAKQIHFKRIVCSDAFSDVSIDL